MKKYLLILLLFCFVKVHAQTDSLNADTSKMFKVSIFIKDDSFQVKCHDCKIKIVHRKNLFEEVVSQDRNKYHLNNHIDTTIRKHK